MWCTHNNNNNKHAYAGTDGCFTHLRALLVLQAPRHDILYYILQFPRTILRRIGDGRELARTASNRRRRLALESEPPLEQKYAEA